MDVFKELDMAQVCHAAKLLQWPTVVLHQKKSPVVQKAFSSEHHERQKSKLLLYAL